MTNPIVGAPGFRTYKDLFPSQRGIGLDYYPYSAISEGLLASMNPSAAAPASAPGNVTVAVTAGRALLDGQAISLGSGVNVTVDPDALANPVTGLNTYYVFLNPTRNLMPIAVGASQPTQYLNGAAVEEGAVTVESTDNGEFIVALPDTFKKFTGGVWKSFNPIFEPSTVPAQPGRNRIYGQIVKPTVAVSNFSVNALEKSVYLGSNYPVGVNSPGLAYLRYPASLLIATVNLYYYVLPYQITVTYTNGSNSATVDVADRAAVAAIRASVSNPNTLALSDGTAQLQQTANYNAATGALELAANYAGTTGVKTAFIVPQTGGNIYVLSPAQSTLEPSGNKTNP
jgi:hypothetical protein